MIKSLIIMHESRQKEPLSWKLYNIWQNITELTFS